MELLLMLAVTILLFIVCCLLIKVVMLRKACVDIADSFVKHIETETNTLIDVPTRDKKAVYLANTVNVQLKKLMQQRRKYQDGDRELKEAVTAISHDLRTPLTAIFGYLNLLEEEEKSDNAARYISYINERTQALKQLTEELFRFSVIMATDDEMTMEEVDLNGALEESVASFYASLIEKKITPVIRLPEKRVLCSANKDALSRVFGNIINNALKYSDGDLEIVLEENGTVTFSNAASGLDEVLVGKLFDRFFTVEAARSSTGLGLTIAKTLVEQMGGEIDAAYGKGRLSIRIKFNAEQGGGYVH